MQTYFDVDIYISIYTSETKTKNYRANGIKYFIVLINLYKKIVNTSCHLI